MNPFVPQHLAQPSHAHSIITFIKSTKVIIGIGLLVSLIIIGGSRLSVFARQEGAADLALVADQGAGGIVGYVVGTAEVAAYACPDANTAKCPVKLMFKPGTKVLIIDNVVGSTVPGLNDNAWRKIRYQGQDLYVPMRYISVTPPGSNPSAGTAPDISLVQTSFEDDVTNAPNFPNGASTSTTTSTTATNTQVVTAPPSFSPAPGSSTGPVGCGPGTCPPSCPPGYQLVPGLFGGSLGSYCSKTVTNTVTTTVTTVKPGDKVTWYSATDGRIDGNAGDRIAIYCRKTGRIEVWSINDNQGRFLVEFNHIVVNAAGQRSFGVEVGDQLVVTFGGDGHGMYWAALRGGPYHATGAGDFAKIFHCYVS